MVITMLQKLAGHRQRGRKRQARVDALRAEVQMLKLRQAGLTTLQEEVAAVRLRQAQVDKLQDEVKKLRGDLKTVVGADTRAMRFVTDLSEGDPIAALHRQMDADPNAASIASGLYQNPETHLVGVSLLARLAGRAARYEFAAVLLGQLPVSFIGKYNIGPAASALSRHDPMRFVELVKALLSDPPDLTDSDVVEICHALASIDEYGLEARVRQTFGALVDPRKFPNLDNLAAWAAKRASVLPPRPAAAATTFGILSYGNPGHSSCNIGDHVQSIAMLGQLIEAGARPVGSASPFASNALSVLGGTERGRGTGAELLSIDRDDLATPVSQGPIWVPVFGWFGHPRFGRRHQLDLPETVRPLFVSFHVAQEGILTPENIAVFKRHEPIGCRDYTTARILRAYGVRSFFSGCVTSTLGTLYRRSADASGNYVAGYHANKAAVPDGYRFVAHLIPELRTMSFEAALAAADALLKTYAAAKVVKTDLLHCYMPCRAIGTPVEFRARLPGDIRFEGLVDASNDDLQRMRDRFATFRSVVALILSGASSDEVYRQWSKVWADEEAATTRYLEQTRSALPDGALLLADAVKRVRRHEIAPAAAAGVTVCFAVDETHLAPLRTTVRSVVASASLPVNVVVLGRGFSREAVATRLDGAGCAGVTHIDCSDVSYGTVNVPRAAAPSSLDPLLLPALLADHNKAIYLDIGVAVRKDIAALWTFELGSAPVAARIAADKEFRRGLILSMGIAERFNAEDATSLRAYLARSGPVDWPVFDTGVLVMDLAKLRAARAAESALAIVKAWRLGARFVMNMLLRDTIAELPPAWNHFPMREMVTDPAIVHYADATKPWEGQNVLLGGEWKRFADKGSADAEGV